VQPHHPARIAGRHAGHVVVADGEKVRDAAVANEAIDDRREAHVHCAALAPRRATSPEWMTKRTGKGVFASALMRAIIASTIRL
jgi:hypothetical protein